MTAVVILAHAHHSRKFVRAHALICPLVSYHVASGWLGMKTIVKSVNVGAARPASTSSIARKPVSSDLLKLTTDASCVNARPTRAW